MSIINNIINMFKNIFKNQNSSFQNKMNNLIKLINIKENYNSFYDITLLDIDDKFSNDEFLFMFYKIKKNTSLENLNLVFYCYIINILENKKYINYPINQIKNNKTLLTGSQVEMFQRHLYSIVVEHSCNKCFKILFQLNSNKINISFVNNKYNNLNSLDFNIKYNNIHEYLNDYIINIIQKNIINMTYKYI